jgi:hypothetical protein
MRVSVPENFQNSAVGRFLFLEKFFFTRGFFTVGVHVRLNGWTVCRFHGARVGGAERQAERQLPARRQDEGNDRGLEAHKITALTTNARQIAKLLADSSAWPKQAAHEDHIGIVPAVCRRWTKFVLS